MDSRRVKEAMRVLSQSSSIPRRALRDPSWNPSRSQSRESRCRSRCVYRKASGAGKATMMNSHCKIQWRALTSAGSEDVNCRNEEQQ